MAASLFDRRLPLSEDCSGSSTEEEPDHLYRLFVGWVASDSTSLTCPRTLISDAIIRSWVPKKYTEERLRPLFEEVGTQTLTNESTARS
jgi:hypothetical protein